MKSSTLNQVNFPPDTANRRFEALLKKEMIEHKHVIDNHDKEMKQVKDYLTITVEKCKSISEKNERDLAEFKAQSSYQINLLKDRLITNEAILLEQRRAIQDLHQQILSTYVLCASKTELEKLKQGFGLESKANSISQVNSFQEFQREVKTMIQGLKNDLVKSNVDMEQKLTRLTEKGENNFTLAKLDKEGILKEFRRYQNDLFVIEKKIENIYTLIDRINKRGDTCPKPA